MSQDLDPGSLAPDHTWLFSWQNFIRPLKESQCLGHRVLDPLEAPLLPSEDVMGLPMSGSFKAVPLCPDNFARCMSDIEICALCPLRQWQKERPNLHLVVKFSLYNCIVFFLFIKVIIFYYGECFKNKTNTLNSYTLFMTTPDGNATGNALCHSPFMVFICFNPKGNQHWIFIRKTDAKDKAPILWPPDPKSQSTRKDSDARKDWRREEKGAIEDEMIEQHCQLNEHKSEQTPGFVKDREPSVLQSIGSQRVRHTWATEQHPWSFICILFISL